MYFYHTCIQKGKNECTCVFVCVYILLVKLVCTHTYMCICTHIQCLLLFQNYLCQLQKFRKAFCVSQNKWFTVLRTNCKTSWHHCTFKRGQQRLCFYSKNELNVIAATLCGLCQILHLLKVSFNFHHCVVLSIQTPFCSFCCFVIVLLSQLQVVHVVLSSSLRYFRIKANKYSCMFLIFLYQCMPNVLMPCIY